LDDFINKSTILLRIKCRDQHIELQAANIWVRFLAKHCSFIRKRNRN